MALDNTFGPVLSHLWLALAMNLLLVNWRFKIVAVKLETGGAMVGISN